MFIIAKKIRETIRASIETSFRETHKYVHAARLQNSTSVEAIDSAYLTRSYPTPDIFAWYNILTLTAILAQTSDLVHS